MITERDIYANIRRLNRSNFQDKGELEDYQREKLQGYVRHQLSRSPYYRSWLGKDALLIPMMNQENIIKNFSAISTLPNLSYQHLFAQAMNSHRKKDSNHKTPYYTFIEPEKNDQWELQVYDEKEQIRKISHYLAILTRNAGSMAIRIAHFFNFNHIMNRLPYLAQTDYRLYDLSQDREMLCQAVQAQQPDILIAPQGALLQLAYDKLKGKLSIDPSQIYCENPMFSTRDRMILRKAFGQVNELYSHGARLLAAACEKGRLHLTENQYFFEFYWIDNKRFIPIYTDFNAQTLPIFRLQSDSIFIANRSPCSCGSAHLCIEQREMRIDDVFWLLGKDNSYVPIFARELEDFAAACCPWDKEYRIEQESLNHVIFSSEGDPQTFANREKQLLKMMQEQGIDTSTLKISYQKLASVDLLRQPLQRLHRHQFSLPTQCNFL